MADACAAALARALAAPQPRVDLLLPAGTPGPALASALAADATRDAVAAKAARHGRVVVVVRGARFSGTAELAAAVAACVCVGGGALEVDFARCAVGGREGGVLDFGPWAAGVEAARRRAADAGRHFGLRGLCLDGVAVRELRAMEVLRELRWLSLRGTALGSLWAVVEALAACAGLEELWLAGGAGDELEPLRVEEPARSVAGGQGKWPDRWPAAQPWEWPFGEEEEEGGGEAGRCGPRRMNIDVVVGLASRAVAELGGGRGTFGAGAPVMMDVEVEEGSDVDEAPEGGAGEEGDVDEEDEEGGEDEDEDEDEDDEEEEEDDEDEEGWAFGRRRACDGATTPVSTVPHYRDFFLARLPQLVRLDSAAISPGARDHACARHAARFEHRPTAVSLARMLAARELGRAPGGPRPRTAQRGAPGVATAAALAPSAQTALPPAATMNKRPREPSAVPASPTSPDPLLLLAAHSAGRAAAAAVHPWAWQAYRAHQHSDTAPASAASATVSIGQHLADLRSPSPVTSTGSAGSTALLLPRPASSPPPAAAERRNADARTLSSSRAAKRPALTRDATDCGGAYPLLSPSPWTAAAEAKAAAAVTAAAVSPPPSAAVAARAEPRGLEDVWDFSGAAFRARAAEAALARPGPPMVDYLTEPGDRPRQFEYSPTVPGQIVYGTNHGDLVVMNQATRVVVGSCRNGGGLGHRRPGEIVSRMPCVTHEGFDEAAEGGGGGGGGVRYARRAFDWIGSSDAQAGMFRDGPIILGLTWLHKSAGKFLAGTEHGAVHMYDVDWMASGHRGGCVRSCDVFGGLTSIHVSADDRQFVVSGYSHDVGLFDVETGLRTETLSDLHEAHINVLKFANHNPNVLVTSSFDRYVKKWDLREARPGGARRPVFQRMSDAGNVMVCFSPDDEFLLVSAVDNEVRQYTAGDGRLERRFDIPTTGQDGNYSRSYYMNGRDYIITGSCKEDVVRVYNARTGRYLREIELDSERSGLVYVQSLRANPLRDFNLSVLLACEDPQLVAHQAPFEMIANVDMSSRTLSIAGSTSLFA